ncbi:RNA-binding transcriptional accessory protein, partial [Cytobacillus sp. NCCP-133]
WSQTGWSCSYLQAQPAICEASIGCSIGRRCSHSLGRFCG